MTTARSFEVAVPLLLLSPDMFPLLVLKFAKVVLQTIESPMPQAAIVFQPGGHLLEGSRRNPARPPLGLAALRDQAGALEHSQMLGYGGKAYLERLGQFGD
jgi:hypothetical protein